LIEIWTPPPPLNDRYPPRNRWQLLGNRGKKSGTLSETTSSVGRGCYRGRKAIRHCPSHRMSIMRAAVRQAARPSLPLRRVDPFPSSQLLAVGQAQLKRRMPKSSNVFFWGGGHGRAPCLTVVTGGSFHSVPPHHQSAPNLLSPLEPRGHRASPLSCGVTRGIADDVERPQGYHIASVARWPCLGMHALVGRASSNRLATIQSASSARGTGSKRPRQTPFSSLRQLCRA